MKYKLYAFDFDLTLADTLEVSVISYKRAYSSIGLGFDEENIFSELGKSIADDIGFVRAVGIVCRSHEIEILHKIEVLEDQFRSPDVLGRRHDQCLAHGL